MSTKAESKHDGRENRKRVAMRASVAAADGSMTIECLIRDASAGGCKIVSDQLHKLPNDVIVSPMGFEKPLTGLIVWRDHKSAGIKFTKPA